MSVSGSSQAEKTPRTGLNESPERKKITTKPADNKIVGNQTPAFDAFSVKGVIESYSKFPIFSKSSSEHYPASDRILALFANYKFCKILDHMIAQKDPTKLLRSDFPEIDRLSDKDRKKLIISFKLIGSNLCKIVNDITGAKVKKSQQELHELYEQTMHLIDQCPVDVNRKPQNMFNQVRIYLNIHRAERLLKTEEDADPIGITNDNKEEFSIHTISALNACISITLANTMWEEVNKITNSRYDKKNTQFGIDILDKVLSPVAREALVYEENFLSDEFLKMLREDTAKIATHVNLEYAKQLEENFFAHGGCKEEKPASQVRKNSKKKKKKKKTYTTQQTNIKETLEHTQERFEALKIDGHEETKEATDSAPLFSSKIVGNISDFVHDENNQIRISGDWDRDASMVRENITIYPSKDKIGSGRDIVTHLKKRHQEFYDMIHDMNIEGADLTRFTDDEADYQKYMYFTMTHFFSERTGPVRMHRSETYEKPDGTVVENPTLHFEKEVTLPSGQKQKFKVVCGAPMWRNRVPLFNKHANKRLVVLTAHPIRKFTETDSSP